MTNYEKITKMSKPEMRRFLHKIIDLEEFDSQFCEKGCPNREMCSNDMLNAPKCASDSYIIRWWLDQDAHNL